MSLLSSWCYAHRRSVSADLLRNIGDISHSSESHGAFADLVVLHHSHLRQSLAPIAAAELATWTFDCKAMRLVLFHWSTNTEVLPNLKHKIYNLFARQPTVHQPEKYR